MILLSIKVADFAGLKDYGLRHFNSKTVQSVLKNSLEVSEQPALMGQ